MLFNTPWLFDASEINVTAWKRKYFVKQDYYSFHLVSKGLFQSLYVHFLLLYVCYQGVNKRYWTCVALYPSALRDFPVHPLICLRATLGAGTFLVGPPGRILDPETYGWSDIWINLKQLFNSQLAFCLGHLFQRPHWTNHKSNHYNIPLMFSRYSLPPVWDAAISSIR